LKQTFILAAAAAAAAFGPLGGGALAAMAMDSTSYGIILICVIIGLFAVRFLWDIAEEHGWCLAAQRGTTALRVRSRQWRRQCGCGAMANTAPGADADAADAAEQGRANGAGTGTGTGNANAEDDDAESVDSEDERMYREQMELAEAEFRDMASQVSLLFVFYLNLTYHPQHWVSKTFVLNI